MRPQELEGIMMLANEKLFDRCILWFVPIGTLAGEVRRRTLGDLVEAEGGSVIRGPSPSGPPFATHILVAEELCERLAGRADPPVPTLNRKQLKGWISESNAQKELGKVVEVISLNWLFTSRRRRERQSELGYRLTYVKRREPDILEGVDSRREAWKVSADAGKPNEPWMFHAARARVAEARADMANDSSSSGAEPPHSESSEDFDLCKQPPIKLPDGSICNYLDYCENGWRVQLERAEAEAAERGRERTRSAPRRYHDVVGMADGGIR